jgi:nucleotide-binding universal stress UspA family protein
MLEIHNVLFGTDFSPAATGAFSHAVAIVNRYNAKLIVAHVVSLETVELLDDDAARAWVEQARTEATRKINELLNPLHLSRERYEIVVGEGEAISGALVEIIRDHHADLAVLGTHGRRGLQKLRMGSVAEEVFRVSPCPVLTVGTSVKSAAAEGLKHILYPVHFVPDSANAAAYAVSLAERYNATLTVMNVRDDVSTSANIPAQISQPVERWMNDHIPQNSDLRRRLRFEAGFGLATDAILHFVEKEGVDMIVMSVRRLDPTIAAHLPKADTAYELVNRATCPALTISEPSPPR